jgi:hypothetical protein
MIQQLENAINKTFERIQKYQLKRRKAQIPTIHRIMPATKLMEIIKEVYQARWEMESQFTEVEDDCTLQPFKVSRKLIQGRIRDDFYMLLRISFMTFFMKSTRSKKLSIWSRGISSMDSKSVEKYLYVSPLYVDILRTCPFERNALYLLVCWRQKMISRGNISTL